MAEPSVRIRTSARLILVNPHNEVFLFQHQDRAGKDQDVTGPHRYWVTPGGGLEPGETWEQAAIRELWEETGIEGVSLGPWVWSRTKEVVFFNQTTRGIERFYLVRVGDVTIHAGHQHEHERKVYRRQRWWSIADIESSNDVFFPERLAHHLVPLLAGEVPVSPITLRPET